MVRRCAVDGVVPACIARIARLARIARIARLARIARIARLPRIARVAPILRIARIVTAARHRCDLGKFERLTRGAQPASLIDTA